jgi:hypothetical protein
MAQADTTILGRVLITQNVEGDVQMTTASCKAVLQVIPKSPQEW